MAHKNATQQKEIEYRRQCVKDTWIKLGVFGVTQQQIVDALAKDYSIEVDQSTVSRDLTAINKAMKERTPDDLKAYLMAEYEYLLSEARQGWIRSQQDAVTETSEMIEVPEVGKDEKGKPVQVTSQRLKASTRRVGQAGDSSFLAEIRQTAKSIREMFGVDAATQTRASVFEVTEEMLSNATEEQLDQLRGGVDPMLVFAVKR